MKISGNRLKEIVLEEFKTILKENENLTNVFRFLRRWGRENTDVKNWSVSKVGDKIEIHGSGPRWGRKVEAIIEPMGAIEGVFNFSDESDTQLAQELYNSIQEALPEDKKPRILEP